jgi:aspartyl aminopeptidase
VDIGLAQLAMHSCYETAGVKDVAYLADAMTTYYSAELTVAKDGSFSVK